MLLESRRFDSGSSAVGGEAATMGEIYDATLESMRLTENANGRGVALERAYDARNDAIKQATGIVLANPMRDVGMNPIGSAGFGKGTVTGIPGLGFNPGDKPFDRHANYQRELEELAAQRPEFAAVIAANRPALEDAFKLAKQAEGNFDSTWSRSNGGLAGWSARTAGGLAGSFYDPLNVALLPLGPTGRAGAGVKGLVWMGVKSGVANAVGEAAIQPAVQAWRAEAGLSYGLDQAALNVGFAALFGFGVDAGVRSAVRGVRRLAGRPYRGPVEALDAAARAAPEGSLLRRAIEEDPEALRELAKATGAINDPAVRAGIEAMESERLFHGMKPERVDDGEHLRRLSAGIRCALAGGSELPPGDAVAAPLAPARPDMADSAPGKLGATEMLEGKPVSFVAIDPQRVTTDAATFQFKSAGDLAGVTDRLRGVRRWDPLSAGKAFIFERLNGELVIADGHQRLGLAKRLADQKPQLHAYVFREADGWTPADVRAHAAMKNMRELSGTSIDMAKVMRERPDLVDDSLPLSDGKMREAAMLAKLSPEAFDAVVAGRLPATFAALIGDHVTDASRHIGLLNELAAADLANAGQARFFLAELMALPTTTETQITLFGEELVTRTVMAERAKVLDASLRALRGDKRIFGLLEREARRIAEGGNVLDRQGNAARAQNAAELAELIEKLSTTKGVVATLLNDAATAVARGYAPGLAARAFTRRIGDLLDAEGINGLLKAADEPPAGGRLDDPNGPEVSAQTEALAGDADQGVMFAIRGFHGSPHDFDRFRMDRIGTGEGAQAFGHGLYFAEAESLGKRYQIDVSAQLARSDPIARRVLSALGETRSEQEAHDLLRLRMDSTRHAPEKAIYAEAIARFEDIKRSLRGNLYEVDIDVEPEQLLDWDAPLGAQPGMVEKLKPLNVLIQREVFGIMPDEIDPDLLAREFPQLAGRIFYDQLVEAYTAIREARYTEPDGVPKGWGAIFRGNEGAADASAALRQAGIPGIRYLDAFSRDAGVGTRNIVVFDDRLITITKKNGDAVSSAERRMLVDQMFAVLPFPERRRQNLLPIGDSAQALRDNATTFAQERLDIFDEASLDAPTFTAIDAVYRAYREWAIQRGIQPMGEDAFARHLPARQVFIAGEFRYKLALKRTEAEAAVLARREARWKELHQEFDKLGAEGAELTRQLGEYDRLTEAIENGDNSFATRRQWQILDKDIEAKIARREEINIQRRDVRDAMDAVLRAPMDTGAADGGEAIGPSLAGATLSARAAATMPDIRADIDNAMNKMLPPGWRHEARDALVYGGRTVEGYADPYERIVYVSLAALDPLERAFEEAGHALKASRLIPAADYEILRAEARRLGAREHFNIDARYGKAYGERWQGPELNARLEEEAIMQMVAAHARGKSFGEPASAARRILDRIVKFLRAVGQALRGRGFRSYDHVFRDMINGRMALPEVDAASRAAAMRDVMFSTGEGGEGSTRRPGTIPDLINGAAAEGRISRDEAAAMLERLGMLETHYRDNPVQAAEQLAQEVDAEAARRQRLALLTEDAQARVQHFVENFRDARGQPDPAKAMIALLEHHGQTPMPDGASSVVGRRQAILGLAMGVMEETLHEFRRSWVLGRTRNRARLENVVREAFGEGNGDRAASGLARAWSQLAEELRQRFNAAGGQIGRLENWGLPQHHDRRAMLNAGMETWINSITPRLDLARMRNPLTGGAMLAADLRASLEYIWRNITAHGWVEREPSMVRFGTGMVANQRAEHRFLQFRNADAWLEYQAEFGGGADPFAAMMNHIRSMAEDIAAMEILGPNPRGMLAWLQQFTLQQAAFRATGQPAHFPVRAEITGRRIAAAGNWLTTKGAEDYARNAVTLTDNMWDIYRGAAGAVVNQRTADAFGTVRNLNVASKLGGAALSAVTDLGFAKMARYFAGLPVTRIWGDMLRAFAANKRDAVRGGLILDSAAQILHQEARWAGSMQGPEWSAYLADRVIASTGLAAWTQAGKHAFGLAIQGELASRAGEAFGELPAGMQRLFRRYGLTAADWDAIRATAAGDPDFLTPSMVQASGVRNLAERYLEMMLQETEYAVPTGGLKALAMSYGGLRRGVARDEFWRSAGQFKMFGLSVAMLQGQRIANEIISGGGLRGAGYAAGLLITTTLYGALAIQLKEIAKGRDPRAMADEKFWGHAVLQSGGLGIYGDFLFAETNRMGGGLARTLVGPTADVAAGVLALGPGNMAQWVRGEKANTGREIVRFLGQNTPGGSNWYLRLAYERVLLDNLQRLVDPEAHAAFRRKIQMQRRDYGNAFYWAPGESAPRRGPDLPAAIDAQ